MSWFVFTLPKSFLPFWLSSEWRINEKGNFVVVLTLGFEGNGNKAFDFENGRDVVDDDWFVEMLRWVDLIFGGLIMNEGA